MKVKGGVNVIGDNIRKYRQGLSMEQSELAERLHISNKTVSSWECGRTEPRMGMIESMCKVFGCQKTDLIDGGQTERPEMELWIKYRNADEDTRRMVDRLLAYAERFGGAK